MFSKQNSIPPISSNHFNASSTYWLGSNNPVLNTPVTVKSSTQEVIASFTDGGLSMLSQLTMNNETISLGGENSKIYFDSGGKNTTITYPVDDLCVIVGQPSGNATSFSTQGTLSASFSSFQNNPNILVQVPQSLATPIQNFPCIGVNGSIATFDVIVGHHFTTGLGQTHRVNLNAYFVQDNVASFSIDYVSSNIPSDWTFTVISGTSANPASLLLFQSSAAIAFVSSSYTRFGSEVYV